METTQATHLPEQLYRQGRNRFGIPLIAVGILPGALFTSPGEESVRMLAYPAERFCPGQLTSRQPAGEGSAYRVAGCRRCPHTHFTMDIQDRRCVHATLESTGTAAESLEVFAGFVRQMYIRYLLSDLSRRHDTCRDLTIVGMDDRVLQTMDSLLAFAGSGLPVLIYGETGTGKELWAQGIHVLSDRRSRTLIPVNCAHLRDETMAMSTLFGHRKGAFTDARTHRPGAFTRADGGTLFLDEIEALPMHAQEMLLRTLEHGEIQPLGRDTPVRVDVRIVAATNQKIDTLMARGSLRKDFYYRIATHYIGLPPLRDRDPGDVLRLARHLLDRLARRYGRHKCLSDSAGNRLIHYDWPGNVRELQNALNSAYFACNPGTEIRPEHLPAPLREPPEDFVPLGWDASGRAARLYAALTTGTAEFWQDVHSPYITGDIGRLQVRALCDFAVEQHGDLRSAARALGIREGAWRKFYLFLYRTIYRGDLPSSS